MHGDVTAASDFECFLPRCEEPLGPEARAGVGVIETAEPRRRLCKLNELICGGVGAGRVVKTRGEAPGTFFHRFPYDRLHIADLRFRGRPVIPSNSPNANWGVPKYVSNVDGHTLIILG